MYKELIQKDIDALEREKSNNIKKNNISKILENIGAMFNGAYLYYGEVPKNNRWKKYFRGGKVKKKKEYWNWRRRKKHEL